jgi:hypothetical protein
VRRSTHASFQLRMPLVFVSEEHDAVHFTFP